VVKAFRKDPAHDKLKVKAGLIDGQVLGGEAVESQLATMPGKNELRAMLLATMQAPLTQMLQLLQAPAQNFAYLLKAKEDKAAEGAG
jgi:large subunit ribosomal protein L10